MNNRPQLDHTDENALHEQPSPIKRRHHLLVVEGVLEVEHERRAHLGEDLLLVVDHPLRKAEAAARSVVGRAVQQDKALIVNQQALARWITNNRASAAANTPALDIQ